MIGRALAFGAVNYEQCPNRDVLQWDGNIRLSFVLDRYQDLEENRFGDFISAYFRGDTWPPLRGLISLLLFKLDPTGLNAITDTLISSVFFLLLFPSLLYIAWRLSGNLVIASVVTLFVTQMLIHTDELIAYSLAAMLETQGMFFLLWSIYFIYRVYDVENRRATQAAPEISRRLKIALFGSIQGLVFTKYPYAIMLFMALVAAEFLRNASTYSQLILHALQNHYRRWRRAGLVALVVIIVVLLGAGKLGYMGLNKKSTKYLIYTFALFFLIDFNYYLYRFREKFQSELPLAGRMLYLLGLLPAMGWILLHPDRFSSILGGTFWPADYRSSFFETLFIYAFDYSSAVIICVGASLIAYFNYAYQQMKSNQSVTTENSIQLFNRPLPGGKLIVRAALVATRLLKEPLSVVFFIIWIQFLAQEIFSPNKQDRHIYHMLPTMLLFSSFWLLRLNNLGARLRPNQFVVLPLALLILMVFIPAVGKNGVLTDSFDSRRHFCFTGKDRSLFEPARKLTGLLKQDKSYILINTLHNNQSANLKSRSLATEIDLLLRMEALQKGSFLRNDSNYLVRDWNEFDSLLLALPQCPTGPLYPVIQERARGLGRQLSAEPFQLQRSDGLCLAAYSFDK